MGFYLSRANRDLVELYAERLKDKREHKFKCSNPEKYERIFRSACQLSEYAWIKEWFIIRVRKNELSFVLRQVGIEEVIEETELISGEDFFGVLNILLSSEESSFKFLIELTGSEVDKLKAWTDKNNYHLTYKDNILDVRK